MLTDMNIGDDWPGQMDVLDWFYSRRVSRQEGISGHQPFAAKVGGGAYLQAVVEYGVRTSTLHVLAGTVDESVPPNHIWRYPLGSFHDYSFHPGNGFHYVGERIGSVWTTAVVPRLGGIRITSGDDGGNDEFTDIALCITEQPHIGFELAAQPGKPWRLWTSEPTWNEWTDSTPLLLNTHADFPMPVLPSDPPTAINVFPHDLPRLGGVMVRYQSGEILCAGASWHFVNDASPEQALRSGRMVSKEERLIPSPEKKPLFDGRGGYDWFQVAEVLLTPPPST